MCQNDFGFACGASLAAGGKLECVGLQCSNGAEEKYFHTLQNLLSYFQIDNLLEKGNFPAMAGKREHQNRFSVLIIHYHRLSQ
jgi:hypothetical protein